MRRLVSTACDFRLPYRLHRALTPALRLTGRTRPLALVAALAATGAFAGCSRASSNTAAATAPIATISQRYQAATDPANAALAAMLKRTSAYGGGSPAEINSAVPATVTSLKNATGQLRGITGASESLHRDIVDVMNAMNTVVGDLNTLGRAKEIDIQPDIARLVADAGREAAADTLVRVAITQLTAPTSLPAEPTLPATTIPPTTTSATSPRRATTPPKATTSIAGSTSTTVARATTTTRAKTTTTVKGRTP